MILFPKKNERGSFEVRYVNPETGQGFLVELSDRDMPRVMTLSEDLRKWLVGKRAKSTVALAAMALLSEHLTVAAMALLSEHLTSEHEKKMAEAEAPPKPDLRSV